MTDRAEIETLLHNLYAARVRADLDGLCETFTTDARFELAGASNASPLSMKAEGRDQYRPLLHVMLKTFKLREQAILSMLIDGTQAAVHWRADVRSRITGVSVPTEFVDVIEIRAGRIGAYKEFFAPS